jgi:ADP-ribosylglycohydrolase
MPTIRFPCDHLSGALRAAARGGGDTDTVAAIAGALAGARWGATAVPLGWRRVLHGRVTYDEPAIDAARLDALARLAARRGRPDGSGWPGIARMGYGRMAPVCVELDGAWFGNVAGRTQALAEGATVVISLCRTGTDEIPAGVEHDTIGLIDTDAADNPNRAFVLHDTARTVADLVDAGERVFVHCARAEHRAPSMAAAYLIRRGADPTSAIGRASAATGGAPSPYLAAQLVAIDDDSTPR